MVWVRKLHLIMQKLADTEAGSLLLLQKVVRGHHDNKAHLHTIIPTLYEPGYQWMVADFGLHAWTSSGIQLLPNLKQGHSLGWEPFYSIGGMNLSLLFNFGLFQCQIKHITLQPLLSLH